MSVCSSVSRNSDSATKLKLSLVSNGDKLVIPPSPVKEYSNNVNFRIKDVVHNSQLSPSLSAMTFGDYCIICNKDESFFDSRPWLDSDCEDDFYSANGDFTPSRGSTPIHQSFSQVNKTLSEDKVHGSVPGMPSPTEKKKKKLIDVFHESFKDKDKVRDELTDVKDIVNSKTEEKQNYVEIQAKSMNGTPYLSEGNSVCNSERTTNGDMLSKKDRQITSAHCFPSLISCSNFVERKKKMSPAMAVNDSVQV